VIKIDLPPLNRHREDIPLLVDHFIHQFNLKKGKNIGGITEQAMGLLMEYEFPGNVRELENIIEHAFVLCHGPQIKVEHLPKEFTRKLKYENNHIPQSGNRFKEAEAQVINEVLKKHNGNREKAVAELGINKSTLWRKMKKLNLP
jgi:transcriptional regulator with PAS, ATPase and Fis domain